MIHDIKKILDKVLAAFCILTLAIMTILVTWQVITRYFFNNPSAKSEQSAQYLFVWLVFYGAAYVFGQREHMRITFLQERLPNKRFSGILDILQELIIGGFIFVVMLLGGHISMSNQMIQLDATLQIPMGIIYSAIPISSLFTLFYTGYNIYQLIRKPHH